MHRCQTCAIPLPALICTCGACLKQPPKLQRCTSVLSYAYPWQDLITHYKFQADLGLARSLGRLLASHPEVTEQLLACDALLPVPTSSQRIQERGFDHSLLLARALAKQTSIKRPVLTNVVQRKHLELAQHASKREQRLRQLRGVFSIEPAQVKQVANRHILLIDDVMTTGATLDALASCLLAAGAASVCAAVLARTP
ncbi:ComF family protein [Comamonas sp. Y33R10-2]|uniref:ComF family protein n=1 Tax=Comamonas sp. Y33R10-2 TaxID=2853257 RepID=UPI002102874A|nr:phosphoribosyltransferase family protein [Comamonas sp. Y33R10-2]